MINANMICGNPVGNEVHAVSVIDGRGLLWYNKRMVWRVVPKETEKWVTGQMQTGSYRLCRRGADGNPNINFSEGE